MSDKIERLKKVYALASEGVDGEKMAARYTLDKLLKKYSLTLDDLNEEIVSEHELEYHGKEQERLLIQCIYKVTNKPGAYNHLKYVDSGRPCRTKMIAKCTEAQKVEIQFLFDFYKSLWEKEREALLMAFIQKHRLFGNSTTGNTPQYTNEEIEKMYALMHGLSDDQPLKQIAKNTETE